MDDFYIDFNGLIDSTKRNLPHWHQDDKLQFVTFHMADSLPQSKLSKLRQQKEEWLKTHPQPWKNEVIQEYNQLFVDKIDYWLDQGYGSCVLKDKNLASIVENSLGFYEGKKYNVYAYVIMSNHVHALISVFKDYKLSKIMGGWKGYTAYAINQKLGRKGEFWQEESFDRLIRNSGHLVSVLEYIQKNIKQGGVLWKI